MWRLLLLTLAVPAQAESVVATRMIRAQSVIGPEDMTLVDADIPGALTELSAALGLEARVAIYPGRPVRPGDLGPAALVDRNQAVTLIYRSGPLTIVAEGRALARGGAGDAVRVQNLSSRTTVTGRVGPDGAVVVGN